MLATYAKKPVHRVNNAAFNAWAQEMGLSVCAASDAAPWHMFATVDSASGYKVRIDFWPHILKAAALGTTYDEGIPGLNRALLVALDA